MSKEYKGIVYFFRHKGISPIKIGHSNKQDYRDRFNQFNMYSPYGAEMLGVIATDNPADLERKIHIELSDKKIRGEFFDISLEKVNEIILRYSDQIQIELMKKTALLVLRELAPVYKEVPASTIKTEKYSKEVIFGIKEACEFFEIKKVDFKKFLNDNPTENKVYRFGDKYIRGFKLYIEQ